MIIPGPPTPGTRITIVGCPKSGTHWLEALYNNAGWKAKSKHMIYSRYRGHDTAAIFRNPRDMVISWVRHNREPLTTENIVNRIHNYYRGNIVEDYESYLGYWGKVKCYQFDDLSKEPEVDSETKTGRHSNMKEYWTGAIEDAWSNVGGFELEKRLQSLWQ